MLEELANIDDNGKVVLADDKTGVEFVLPEYAEACRCKDQIDVREMVSFTTVQTCIDRRRTDRPVRWLDICCGNGNILSRMKDVLGRNCSNVEYIGIDFDRKNLKECQKVIGANKLNDCMASKPKVYVRDIGEHLPKKWKQFDIVTLLNVMHEIPPYQIYDVLRNALDRCKYSGELLIIDMYPLPHTEWKAITWSGHYLEELIAPLLKNKNPLHSGGDRVEAAVFKRTVDVVTLHIRKSKIDMNRFPSIPKAVIEEKAFNDIIESILVNKKKDLSDQILSAYMEEIEKTAKDQRQSTAKIMLQQLIWEYWAVAEALVSGPSI